jgi:hypothetical protein
MLLTQAVLTTAVFAVAIARGQGGTTIVELALIAVAAAGITGWLLSGEPSSPPSAWSRQTSSPPP